MPSDSMGQGSPPPGAGGSSTKKTGIIIGVALLIGVAVYMFARTKSSGSTTGGATSVVLPSGTSNSSTASMQSDVMPYINKLGSQVNTLSSHVSQMNSGMDMNQPSQPTSTGS
jgi:outer membrane murein-binding lipoprotein Lpp